MSKFNEAQLREMILNGKISRGQLITLVCVTHQKTDTVFVQSLECLTDGQLVDLICE